MKLWQLYDQKICNDKLVRRNVDYLLEGFKFNRRFAQDVCLGIVPVKVDDDDNKKIYRGRLIEKPEKSLLKPRVEYAFMMRHLNEDSRLDSQLKPRDQSLCIRAMLEFLAREVAVMHIQLEKSARNRGSSDSILSKLKINIELFEDALNKLIHDNKHFTKYRWITSLMVQACKSYTEFFEQRREEDHIKRCHGDLKVSNLWINPEKSYFCGLKKYPQQLIALDCVDFNPEFCHIDTLSDVAMLVIDLEMHLSDWYRQEGEELAQYFLECYLYKMKEDGERWKPLLEYYMTEKSLVCTYVSILYDTQPEVGKRYLEVALAHAQRLQKLLKSTEYTSTLRQIAIAAKESI